MGDLIASPKKSLLAGEITNAQSRRKKNDKEKINNEFKPKEYFDPAGESSGSKKEKHHRFDKGKCSYCKKGNHIDKGCMKKTIDQMSRLLEQHNISLLEGTRKVDSGDNTEDHEICHELKVGFSKCHAFLIDSGTSNHMVASKE